jgi:hypothetical protein
LKPVYALDVISRLSKNAQQAVVEVEELLFRGHPDVVDADLAGWRSERQHLPGPALFEKSSP